MKYLGHLVHRNGNCIGILINSEYLRTEKFEPYCNLLNFIDIFSFFFEFFSYKIKHLLKIIPQAKNLCVDNDYDY